MSNDKNTFTVPEANGFHELEQDEVKKNQGRSVECGKHART